LVNHFARIRADALNKGNGGKAIVWSDGNTEFFGTVTAKGGSISGDGGLLEVSGKLNLGIGDSATTDASATMGNAGTLLLDPASIVVDDTGGLAFFDLVDPNANGTDYADNIVTLANGNIVVQDINDDAVATASGAVYLYNGKTGALINTVTGTSANDQVGFGQGVKELTGGDFVIASRNWDAAAADVGAVTLISGSLGTIVTGGGSTVTTANSLHGTTASDQIGIGALVALANGNFAVISAFWDGGVWMRERPLW
jgi:trimeric autotransporter adhesin